MRHEAQHSHVIYPRYSLIEMYELVSLLMLVPPHHNLLQKPSHNKSDVIEMTIFGVEIKSPLPCNFNII